MPWSPDSTVPSPQPKPPQAPTAPPGQTTSPVHPQPATAGEALFGQGGRLAQPEPPATFARPGSKEYAQRGFQGATFAPYSMFRTPHGTPGGSSMRDILAARLGGLGRMNVSDVAGMLNPADALRFGGGGAPGVAFGGGMVDGGLGSPTEGSPQAGSEQLGPMINQMLQRLAFQVGG